MVLKSSGGYAVSRGRAREAWGPRGREGHGTANSYGEMGYVQLTGRIGANIVEVELNRVQCLAGTRAECQALPGELGGESHSLSFL